MTFVETDRFTYRPQANWRPTSILKYPGGSCGSNVLVDVDFIKWLSLGADPGIMEPVKSPSCDFI